MLLIIILLLKILEWLLIFHIWWNKIFCRVWFLASLTFGASSFSQPQLSHTQIHTCTTFSSDPLESENASHPLRQAVLNYTHIHISKLNPGITSLRMTSISDFQILLWISALQKKKKKKNSENEIINFN